MLLIDSHCHLNSLDYYSLHKNIDDVMKKAKICDVKLVLAVETTLPRYLIMTQLIGKRDDVIFSCGVHPLNLKNSDDYRELNSLAKSKKVVALGETGLDYFYPKNNVDLQKLSFRKHIRIACSLNKPLIVHTRNACSDTLTILREENAQNCGGILHCFTEDRMTASVLLNFGFYISFSGIITFRNSEKLREVVRYLPLDCILVETDSPYLSPIPHRGKENQPAYVRDIAQCIAKLKGVSLEKFSEITTNNFFRLFKMKV
ncbi:putative metal-dependent hydrolase YcfH [Candidatus Ecksteinia adelgidicola]|nr:putative metal-dependent hydrolase YcfH [Candidatus Ecksteinia adelgidicola]